MWSRRLDELQHPLDSQLIVHVQRLMMMVLRLTSAKRHFQPRKPSTDLRRRIVRHRSVELGFPSYIHEVVLHDPHRVGDT